MLRPVPAYPPRPSRSALRWLRPGMDAEAVDENSGWRLAFPIKVTRQNAHTRRLDCLVQRWLLGGIGIEGGDVYGDQHPPASTLDSKLPPRTIG